MGVERQLQSTAAIVFGGASGLGEAAARRLARAGAAITVADLNEDRGSQLARELGGRFASTDVCDAEQVQAAVALAGADGDLRVSVCCAGLGIPGRLLGREGPAPLEHFARVINVNLLGTINVLRLVSAQMRENDPAASGERGVCVNTASIAAYEGQIGQVAYSASKGGIVGLTLPAARELARYGIRVMAIAPGIFNTPMLSELPESARESLGASVPFPARLGEPEEFAELVAHIVANPMLNGSVIRLDGALRMAPR